MSDHDADYDRGGDGQTPPRGVPFSGQWTQLIEAIRHAATVDPATLVSVQRGSRDGLLHRTRKPLDAWCGAAVSGSVYVLHPSAIDCERCA